MSGFLPQQDQAPLVYVVGPTATGKSDLAIELGALLSSEVSAEIVSADSVQIYKELEIGSARPSQSDLNKIQHHFIAHVSVADEFTAGNFEREARALIDANTATPFVVVGGSGFYIQALEKGMYPIAKAEPGVIAQLEQRVATEGLSALYRELVKLDPEAARSIASADEYRILRALEILQQLPNGQTLTLVKTLFAQDAAKRFVARPKRHIGLFLSKERLEKRVRARVVQMLTAGLLEEVEGLLKSGFRERPAMQTVGYRECVAVLDGLAARAELVELITNATLRLAKKQKTWFSRDSAIRWFDAELERKDALNWGSSVK